MSQFQQGFDECMHLIFQEGRTRDLLVLTAMLNCQPFPSWPQGSLDLQHMAQLEPGEWDKTNISYTPSLDNFPGTPSLVALLQFLLPLGGNRTLYFDHLQEFFNDPIRAQSLLITEDTYMAAACAWFTFLDGSAW